MWGEPMKEMTIFVVKNDSEEIETYQLVGGSTQKYLDYPIALSRGQILRIVISTSENAAAEAAAPTS